MNADLIVVIEKGKIVEQGSHEQLIFKRGRYEDLWSKQAFLKPHKYTEDQGKDPDTGGIANGLSADKTAAEPSKTKSHSRNGGEAQLGD